MYKRTLIKFRNSRFRKFIRRHEKHLLILFFIGGFVFDSLTLGRIDRVYDLSVLCFHMTCVTLVIYLFNLRGDGQWKNTFLERYQLYFPLAIQFFFGALASAFIIYFSRSVSMTKTISFFIILIALFVANELFKKRISNKYLQFSLYFFINFTFFSFMIPVIVKKMGTLIFIISGIISLGTTLLLLLLIYRKSPSTRLEIKLPKLIGLILIIYTTINVFYFSNLIPPVPLALESGIVAHNVERHNNHYWVTYERDDWYIFWRDYNENFHHKPEEKIFVFTSVFAPTAIKKSIYHRWKWFDDKTDSWQVADKIGYEITGGRDEGYRGYTYKNNIKPGLWEVDVITEEGLILGIIDFKVIQDTVSSPKRIIEREF